jgi:biotin operon repressor
MQTLLDTLADLANDGKWYSMIALGAKLHVRTHNVTAAIRRLRKVPGYGVEKRRLTGHAKRCEYRITAGPSYPTA